MPPTPDAQTDQMPIATPKQQGDAAAAGPQPSQATPDNTQVAPVSDTTVPPAAAPAAAPTAQSIGDKTKHVLGDIFQTIAGGQKVVWQQGPNGPVKTYQDLKPGEMARGILAAAITGLASGYDPANRGKGPAMSSAFASGFRGEQAARTNQQDQQEKEAQQTFANQNASDELLMKKAKAAQDQQEGILRMQNISQMMKENEAKAGREGITFTQEQQDLLKKQDNEYYANQVSGATNLQDPKNPGHELVLYTQKQANQYINDHKDQLLAPGEFNTIPMQRPGVGGWVIQQIPLKDDDKRSLRFAKIGKDGKPETDSKGNYIPLGGPDGTDQTGQPIKPGVMSGAEFRNKMKEVQTYKENSATIQERLAKATKERADSMKDEYVVTARKQLDAAGGDPTGYDVSTGLPKLGFTNQSTIKAQDMRGIATGEDNLRRMKADLENTDPKTPEAAQKRADIEKTIGEVDSYKQEVALLRSDITRPDGMASSLLKEFKGDPDKASKLFEDNLAAGKYKLANMRPDEINSIRENLKAAKQTQQQQGQQKKENPKPKDAVEAFIQDQSVEDDNRIADDLSESAKVWGGDAAPKSIPIGRNMGANPNYTEAEAYVAANPKLSPDERAAIRNAYDIKSGRVSPPSDPGAAASIKKIEKYAGTDREKIRALIAAGSGTPEQKEQLYQYFYLTPPTK